MVDSCDLFFLHDTISCLLPFTFPSLFITFFSVLIFVLFYSSDSHYCTRANHFSDIMQLALNHFIYSFFKLVGEIRINILWAENRWQCNKN